MFMQMGIFPDKPWELYLWDKSDGFYCFKTDDPADEAKDFRLIFNLNRNECEWVHTRLNAFAEDDWEEEEIDSLYIGEEHG